MRVPLTLPPPASREFDVVGFGQNSVDLVAVIGAHPQPDSHVRAERIAQMPGGEIATAMVACARLGCRTRYIGAFGSDEHGRIIEERLRSEGIDLEHVVRVDAPNRFAFVLVDHEGRRTVVWHRDAKIERLASVIDLGAAASGRVLLVDASDPEAAAAAARSARAAGTPVVLDIDAFDARVVPLLRATDVIIASESFLRGYLGEGPVAEGLSHVAAEFRPALAVATLGIEGSLALCDGQQIHTPAFIVPVIDSTGAGDAFRGGFVASWLRFGDDCPVDKLLRYASAVAARNCLTLGAQTGLPRWPDVDLLVTEKGHGRSK